MSSFLPEGNVPLPSDDAQRSLLKIVGLLGSGAGGGGSGSVFSGNYGGGVPTQTPTGSSAIAYDNDAPYAVWHWNGSSWY